MNLGFAHPFVLLLLPLAVLPLLLRARDALPTPWLHSLPADRLSEWLDRGLVASGVTLIALLILAWSGPYVPEASFKRIGHGAEIVLLLDRSRSMDQSFGPLTNTLHAGDDHHFEIKAAVAKQLIANFAASRSSDVFSMISFSNIPIRTLDFTQKQEAVQSAILASNIGRGLADTDIGLALEAAGQRFNERTYSGSRIVMLVSDGGGQIDPDLRKILTQLYRRNHISLYWIYIRSYYSPPLTGTLDTDNEDAIPERFLNKFFTGMGVPYHAYEATSAEAMKAAIDDVGRVEAQPIELNDVLPRQDLSPPLYAMAVLLAFLLAFTRFSEMRSWSHDS